MAEDDDTLLNDGEPVSPVTRFSHVLGFNLYIVLVFGFSTAMDEVSTWKKGLEETLLTHPRFSSILVMNGNKESWQRTKVNIDDHITIPDLDPEMEGPDEFVEDYVSSLSTTPMDLTRPLWEIHALNVKTSDAKATVVFRIHHSIGDGASLISVLLACTRKSADPQSLPTLPCKKQKVDQSTLNELLIRRLFLFIWSSAVILYNTVVSCIAIMATLFWVKDTPTPIKGPSYGFGLLPRRFVHRILSLDDIKLVKNALNVTINDVILGVTQAGISLYLNRQYGRHYIKGFGSIQKSDHLPKNLRVTASVAFNNRPPEKIEDLTSLIKKTSKETWGNVVGVVLLPLTISLQDNPLTHIYQAKTIMDRKKRSLEPVLSLIGFRLLFVIIYGIKLLGMKWVTDLTKAALSNTTFGFSNVAGPQEEITFYGYPISYIAPSVSGVPQALTMHWLSYNNKLIISLAVDEDVIKDPHQLCNDFVMSLEVMKNTVLLNRAAP